MKITKNDRLFDNVNIAAIPDRHFRVLNALDVFIYRCLEKYEVIFQIVAQDKTGMNRNLVLMTWEIVDWLERTRKILGYGAGLKKSTPEFQMIMRSLENAKELRNTLQHFDSFLNRSDTHDLAPLGAVSVIHTLDENNMKAMVYTLGTIKPETNLGNAQIPKVIYDEVDHVTLQLDGQELNISEMLRKLLPFYAHLREQISEKYPKKETI